MKTIHLLDEACINKIAAGEIVDRPAHIVKELVENALDAHAKNVTVELRNGGIDLISVTDDGKGISDEDLPLALKRHATSKIRQADDLLSVTSMGFRGEALSAISAVSRFVLASKTKETQQGTMMQVEPTSGSQPKVTSMPWHHLGASQQGTSIQVQDLFFNIPARLKFLKSSSGELRSAVDWIKAFAIAFPKVNLTLKHNGNMLHHFGGAASNSETASSNDQAWQERVKMALDSEQKINWIFGQSKNEYGTLRVMHSAPGCDRPSSTGILIFVNNRWVQDKNIRFSILRAYHSHLLSGRYPLCVVDLQVDPTLVDQNVHPTKTEVKLQYANEFLNLIVSTIRQGLRSGDWAANSQIFNSPEIPATSKAQPLSFENRSSSRSFSYNRPPTPPRSYGSQYSPAMPTPNLTSEPAEVAEVALAHENTLIETLSEAKFLGSFAQCYLMFEHSDRLIAIDQHAFHERILFERLINNPQLMQHSEQVLLPLEVDLPEEIYGTIKTHAELLNQNGFKIELDASQKLKVTAVPALLKNFDIETLLTDIAASINSGDSEDATKNVATDIVATIACHSAVRAGETVSDVEVTKLLNEARSVDFFHNCPHGRRVIRIFKRSEVESWFDR